MASDVTPPPHLARCYRSVLNEIISSSKVGVTMSGQFAAFSRILLTITYLTFKTQNCLIRQEHLLVFKK